MCIRDRSKFLKFRYAEKYDRLIILVLGDRKKFQKEVDTGGVFTFSIKDDVIDIGRILRDIRNCDDETLKNIYDYIEYQFIERNKKEQSFSSVEYVTDPPTNQCRFYRGRTVSYTHLDGGGSLAGSPGRGQEKRGSDLRGGRPCVRAVGSFRGGGWGL